MLKSDGDGRVYYYRYECDGIPMGEAQLHLDAGAYGPLMLWAFEIHPPYQGQGHGKAFLDLLIDEARAMLVDVPQLLLYVGPSNTAARKLYDKAGFRVVKEDERGILMEKDL